MADLVAFINGIRSSGRYRDTPERSVVLLIFVCSVGNKGKAMRVNDKDGGAPLSSKKIAPLLCFAGSSS